MATWIYGVSDQGDPQLLGPFESDDEAEGAGAELNGLRIINAPTRQAAIARLQRQGAPHSQRRAEPVDDFSDVGNDNDDF